MTEVSFDRVISDHLALSERNRRLEPRMPLDRYREQVGRGSPAPTPPGPALADEPETKTLANAKQEEWLEPGSFWDASGERPLPEFDWGDD
jgi:hypothetical protein